VLVGGCVRNSGSGSGSGSGCGDNSNSNSNSCDGGGGVTGLSSGHPNLIGSGRTVTYSSC